MMYEESHQAGHIMNEDIRGSGVARGPRGPCPPPKTFGKWFFSN